MTYIILVNWNGWRDTIECLESVLRMTETEFRVIVVDNGSEDGSLAKIKDWARGNLQVHAHSPAMKEFSFPPIPKPVPFYELNRTQAAAGTPVADVPLILIGTGENLGFAGGNNVALRYALQQPEMRQAWLLNNDTVVDRGALAALLSKLSDRSKIGLVGSTLLFYHQPNKVQAFGGARYFRCIGLAVSIGRFRSKRRRVDEIAVERRMDYIVGASMLVSREFLETVGLMTEDYFLYYEELDWAQRGCRLFAQAYAQDSLVMHKAGQAIGSSRSISVRSFKSDEYLMANRLEVTRRFFPRCQFTVRAFLLIEALIRLLLGRRQNAKMIFNLARSSSASNSRKDVVGRRK